MRWSRAVARAGAAWMARVAARMGLAAAVDPVSVEMATCFRHVDASRAERALGWTRRDPAETLRETVADLRTRAILWPSEGAPTA